MKGSMHLWGDVRHPWWFVLWSDRGNIYKITKYMGKRMFQTHPVKERDFGYDLARKLLSQMQADVERGVFRIEKYTEESYTDVIQFFKEWLETKRKKKPATYKVYKSYFRRWIRPFFEKNPVMLHDVQLNTLNKLLDSIHLSGKGKMNVMMCFHVFMDYA